jgi:hypothetical protein
MDESNLILIFLQHLIVPGNGDEEDTPGDLLKTMYPLTALRSLASDIANSKLAMRKCDLNR